jgi:N-acetylmuramoyl-L-alanine amidase
MKRVIAVGVVVAFVVVISLVLAGAFRRSPETVEVAAAVPARPAVTLVLDPGHGGRDPGAVVGDFLEKDINLEIVSRVKALADAHPDLAPVLTRELDVYVEKTDRVQLADQVGAALYLSIHVNACDYPEVHGVETWVDDTRASDDPSWILATAVQDAVVEATAARDRGIRSQQLYLRHTTLPAASIEVGFLTCNDERAKLLDPAYQDHIAQGIVDGIVAFLEATKVLPPATTPSSSL